MTRCKCPSCDSPLESEADLRGQQVECPECHYLFTVPKIMRMDKAYRPSEPSKAAQPNTTAKKGKNAYFGCFMLGFVFNFVGIFISHMIDGTEGARAALRGMLLEMLSGAILYAALTLAY